MGKYISFGQYNKQYKYIWIYVSIRLINDYFFSEAFPKQIRPDFIYTVNYPRPILVQIFFNYLGSLLFSFCVYLYLKYQSKEEKKEKAKLDYLSNILTEYKINQRKKSINLNMKLRIIITIFLSISSIQLINLFYIVSFNGLIYWIFDIFFMSYINQLMFENPIFSHKKIAIIIMVVFIFIFKFLSTLEYIMNDDYNLFYKNHIIIIPIFIIIYIILSLIRAYSICKMKYYLNYKLINLETFLITYNSIGLIIFLVASLISTFVKCVDKSKIFDIDLICLIKIEKENKENYYFDNFFYFFEQLWRTNRKNGINVLYLILFIIRLFLNGARILYIILIINYLSPEFYLCAYDLYYNILRYIELINVIINGGNIRLEIYNVLTEIGALVGIFIYLELIELKFMNLNLNIKKNIQIRSNKEYELYNLDEEDIVSEKEE